MRKTMGRHVLVIAVMILLVSIPLFGAPQGEEEKPIVWKAVSYAEKETATTWHMGEFIKKVNELSEGRIRIDWLGGDEVMPASEQAEALKTGVIDVLLIPFSYYKAILPEGGVCAVSPFSYEEERAQGIYDYWRKLHAERMNTYYLGGAGKGARFIYCSNVNAGSLADFNGLKFRASPQYVPLNDMMGVTSVMMPGGETYTAIERKVVDGFSMLVSRVPAVQLHEVTKFYSPYLFWNGEAQMLLNLDSWNALPDELKELIEEIQIEIEPRSFLQMKDDDAKAIEAMKAGGMMPMQWSQADQDLFYAYASEVKWAELGKKIPDQQAFTEMKDLFTR